jgi:IclR family acetate operon transcriptional repressor
MRTTIKHHEALVDTRGVPVQSAPYEMLDERCSSIAKAATVLRCYTSSDESLRLIDFVRRTGMPKTTILRLVRSLVAEGLLQRSTVGFQLGLPLFELGQLASRQLGLREVALSAITHLHQSTGLITNLAVLDDGNVLYLEKLGDDKNRLPSRIGGKMPASCTALGKAMLAFSPAPKRSLAVQDRPSRLTPFSIVHPSQFARELAEIARTGVAFDREESLLGVTCAASPILHAAGTLAGAVSVTYLGTRRDLTRAGTLVRTAANEVNDAIAKRAEHTTVHSS